MFVYAVVFIYLFHFPSCQFSQCNHQDTDWTEEDTNIAAFLISPLHVTCSGYIQ